MKITSHSSLFCFCFEFRYFNQVSHFGSFLYRRNTIHHGAGSASIEGWRTARPGFAGVGTLRTSRAGCQVRARSAPGCAVGAQRSPCADPRHGLLTAEDTRVSEHPAQLQRPRGARHRDVIRCHLLCDMGLLRHWPVPGETAPLRALPCCGNGQ